MLHSLDLALFEAANSLAGRSYAVDAMMALALNSPVVKGGPIAACFILAWWHAPKSGDSGNLRATLLVTLLALFLVAPVMKILSTASPISPRPLVAAEEVVISNGAEFTRLGPVAYRPPSTGQAARLAADARNGTVASNDLFSFPSDHAALFTAFALGIFIAMRGPGLVALGWLVFVVMLPRVATGMHWPSDMLVGALAGAVLLALALLIGKTVLRRMVDKVLALGERFTGLAQAVLLLALFEAASGMATLNRLAELVLERLAA